MLLSVSISTASPMLLICLTWWGFHIFFHTLIIFSIKVTEIHSPISNLALNERQWKWNESPCMKGCSAFSHAVPSPEEHNLYFRWSSLSLFTQVARTMTQAHLTPAIMVSCPNCCCLHPSSLDGDYWMSFSSSAPAQASSTCFCQCHVHVPWILLSLA